MSNGLAVLERNPITIEGETYTIANVPDGSKLVLKVRSRILAEMKLDDLLSKLQLVGKLLFVAYNGVATEPKLRGELSTLQVNYMTLCAKSYEAMVAFDDYCTKMLGHLKNLFNYLLNGKEDLALLYLSRMGQVADEMAKTATELATGFQEVFLQATRVLADTEVAKGTEEEKLRALEEQRIEFEALSEKAKSLAEEIAKSKVKLQQLYDEAKAAAEKAEGRAFTLELVGSIFGGLGQAVGGIASTAMALKSPFPAAPAAPAAAPKPPKAGKKEDVAVAQAKAKEAETAAEAAKTKAGGLKAEAATAKTEFDKAEKEWKKLKGKKDDAKKEVTTLKAAKKPDAAKIKTAQGKVDAAQEKLDEAKEKFNEAKTKLGEAEEKEKETAERYKLLAAGLQQIGGAISDAGGQVRDMGRGYAAIAAEYNQEKRELLQNLLDEGEQEREALASIKEYAVRMEGLKDAKSLKDLVIDALHQAVGALKQVVVILSNAADLWRRMARHCKNLSSGAGGLKETITIMKEDPDRLVLYQDEAFVTEAVTHYAEWKALQMISKEYSVAANNVKIEVQGNVQTNLTTEAQLALAVKEGKVLLQSANAGIGNLDANEKALREVLEATPQSSEDAGV